MALGTFLNLLALLTAVYAHNVLFPYGYGTGDQPSAISDDACEISYDFGLHVFQQQLSPAYICTNGIICFGQFTRDWTPDPFPLHSGNMAVIAPYWGDADPTKGGRVWSRVSTDTHLLNSISSMVRSYSGENFQGVAALVATWDRVHHYSDSDHSGLENTFQAVVVTDRIRAFAIYLYGNMQWPGGELRNVRAQIGYDVGTGVDYYNHPYSRTPSIINATRGSNVGHPGHWMFKLAQRLDECSLGLDNCHQHATCTDTDDSFECTCNPGYTGDGVDCAVESCSSHGNTYTPVPHTNCTKFTQSLGQPNPPVLSCPDGTNFNIRPCVCDYPYRTNCQV